MTLQVYTARIGTRDSDALDITRGSGRGALAFAPSEAILWPAINARREADKLREEAVRRDALEEGLGTTLRRRAEELEQEAWAIYEPKFIAEMRISKGMTAQHPHYGALERLAEQHGARPHRAAWGALLARPRVVLTCFCTNPERCHRRLLARILAKLGAVDHGELPIANRDRKPDNSAYNGGERAEITALVSGFLTLFQEWSDALY